jgi:hypothetical protein
MERQPAKLEEMPDFLTVEPFHEVLPMIGKNKLYERIGDGTIPSKKLGRRVVVQKVGRQIVALDRIKTPHPQDAARLAGSQRPGGITDDVGH